ncbi:hypothetical protein [Catenuloplanes indicus]|uniref:Uncharacterized protein n=1 Tax=Catenuloplanes indicus TaxID=137267 RepID=A0AAE3VWL0_9ACTN|nr:hypothetical protein [Catenuloplanes indicus]MDQ0365079.1 hypothetical protein [Catenuloplanes indicus]
MTWLKDLVPLLAALIGACAVLGGQLWADHRQQKSRRAERWGAFQHETLLDLHETATKIFELKWRLEHKNPALMKDWTDDERKQLDLAMLEHNARISKTLSRLDNRELAKAAASVISRVIDDDVVVEEAKARDEFFDLLDCIGQEVRLINHAA